MHLGVRGTSKDSQVSSSDLFFLLTVSDVAALLRTSQKAVYAMVERGQLPGVNRIGRRVLIRRDHLLEWLDHNCTPSPQENRR